MIGMQAEGIFRDNEQKLKQKENIIVTLKEEINRRKYVEAKVQSYVKALLQQNEKYKETLEWITQQSNLSDHVKTKCQETLDEVEEGQDVDDDDEIATDL